MKRIGDEFSQDWEIFRIVTSDVRGMPTFVELQTQCNTQDIFDLIEILDCREEMIDLDKSQNPTGEK